jgi:hypothetical protein
MSYRQSTSTVVRIPTTMPKKRKKGGNGGGKKAETSDAVWIAPRYSLKGPNGERAWENRPGGPPHSSKFLELADVALGLKKPVVKKRKGAADGIHVTTNKTEPYTR